MIENSNVHSLCSFLMNIQTLLLHRVKKQLYNWKSFCTLIICQSLNFSDVLQISISKVDWWRSSPSGLDWSIYRSTWSTTLPACNRVLWGSVQSVPHHTLAGPCYFQNIFRCDSISRSHPISESVSELQFQIMTQGDYERCFELYELVGKVWTKSM